MFVDLLLVYRYKSVCMLRLRVTEINSVCVCRSVVGLPLQVCVYVKTAGDRDKLCDVCRSVVGLPLQVCVYVKTAGDRYKLYVCL